MGWWLEPFTRGYSGDEGYSQGSIMNREYV